MPPSPMPFSHNSSDRDEEELSDGVITDADLTDTSESDGFGDIYTGYDGAVNDGPSSSAGPSAASSHLEVAKRSDKRTVRIDAINRQPLETMYLRTPSARTQTEGKATAQPYKVESDGPAVAICPIDPDPHEMIPKGDNTLACIEVGLMHGDNPKKFFSGKGGRAGTGGQAETQPAPTQAELYTQAEPRGPDMVRIFVPKTQFINDKAPKFYAGCHARDGRLELRLVSADTVYFYPEVWKVARNLMSSRSNLRERKPALTKACKELAAINAEQATFQGVTVTKTKTEKLLAIRPLVVTQSEHLASLLVLQLSMFEITQDTGYLDAMEATIMGANPDFRFRQSTKSQGANAFMDFSEPLTNENASSLKQELKIAFPHMNPDENLLKRIHAVLCKPLGGDSRIGDSLQMRALAYFLETCEFLQNDGHYISDDTHFENEVSRALTQTRIHMRHTNIETFRPPLDEEEDYDGENTGAEEETKSGKAKRKGLSQGETRQLLSFVTQVLKDVHHSSFRSAEAVVQQHGGLLGHASMEELMSKVARTVDVNSLKVMVKQISAFDATILHTAHRDHVAIIGDVARYLETVQEIRLPREE